MTRRTAADELGDALADIGEAAKRILITYANTSDPHEAETMAIRLAGVSTMLQRATASVEQARQSLFLRAKEMERTAWVDLRSGLEDSAVQTFEARP